MQRVERINPNVSPAMDDIDNIYAYLSDKPDVALVKSVYDESFKDLVDTFREWGKENWQVEYHKKDYPALTPIENNNIILAFSGGKDSIASALRYKEQGYNVYLYHLRHINPSFADEWQCAQDSANMLGLPIFFDDVRFMGYHKWTEHPMKNMLIANGALSYGIREGITTDIAFGNYTTSYLDDNVFDRCAGDCSDMWETYEAIIQRVLPDFMIQMNLDNMGDTLDAISDRKDLLNASLSCLCRHSLREYRKNWVKTKFGIDLFKRRCGSCYKCCVEYIYMTDHNKMPYSEDYYKYCMGQLYRVARVEKIQLQEVSDLWDNYFMYDISESHITEDLKTAKLGISKIIWKRG